jgi:predicted adenylyl cyclase CyaB
MKRNIEIKARVHEPEGLRERALSKADSVVELEQEDRFFKVPKGRLKLRSVNGRGELIYYERPSRAGPKLSRYRVVPIEEKEALNQLLDEALGSTTVVKKRRTVIIVGQTRVHLDDVENLGHFMELEVVLDEEQSEEEGIAIAHDLMRALHISQEDLLDCAYVDLLKAAGHELPEDNRQ